MLRSSDGGAGGTKVEPVRLLDHAEGSSESRGACRWDPEVEVEVEFARCRFATGAVSRERDRCRIAFAMYAAWRLWKSCGRGES